jgi:hypothetical protein
MNDTEIPENPENFSTSLKGKKVEIPDERVKWDFEQHDRYQSYSSELIKLALGGMAIVGFLITLLLKDGPQYFEGLLNAENFWCLLKIGTSCLAASCGLALVHKYLASDGMSDHLSAIKRLIWMEKNPGSRDRWDIWESLITHTEDSRTKKFIYSGHALNLAAISFGLGVILIAASIFQVTPEPKQPDTKKPAVKSEETQREKTGD